MTNITNVVAAFARALRLEDIDETTRTQARRALLNYFGCACGGADHEAVEAVLRSRARRHGSGCATAIGRAERVDPLLAALVNGMSSAVYSFDDTHADALVHPTGPVASALLAACEGRLVSGEEFLRCFVVGAELTCRLSKAISAPPAAARPEWLQTSVCGGLGAACASAAVLGASEAQIASAVGLAAGGASGFRGLSKSMCFSFVAGSAARAGLEAAWLALDGMVGPQEPLAGSQGFLAVFSNAPNADALTSELGERFELARDTFKPFPCGVVLHPVIQACLDMEPIAPAAIAAVRVEVAPAVVRLADLREPKDQFEAQMSIQHWAACALLRRRAGVEQTAPSALADPALAQMRDKVILEARDDLSRTSARVTVTRLDGSSSTTFVAETRGAFDNPMTDEELLAKYRAQAEPRLGRVRAEALADACMTIETCADIAPVMELAGRAT